MRAMCPSISWRPHARHAPPASDALPMGKAPMHAILHDLTPRKISTKALNPTHIIYQMRSAPTIRLLVAAIRQASLRVYTPNPTPKPSTPLRGPPQRTDFETAIGPAPKLDVILAPGTRHPGPLRTISELHDAITSRLRPSRYTRVKPQRASARHLTTSHKVGRQP